jgi:APA family basic amino acid/polyamine antiporter
VTVARLAVSREGLRVALGLPSAVMLVIGGVIGVGIFVNPAIVAHGLPSPAFVLLAWVVGGAIALLGALVYAELAAIIPATGGEYAYLRETYGPLAGFLFGWTTLLVVHTGGKAAVTIIFAKNFNLLVGGGLSEPMVVVATLVVLAAINCLGVTWGAGVQNALGSLKIAAIGVLVVAGLLIVPHAVQPHPVEAPPPRLDLVKAFGAALIPIMFSYGGWQTANFVAGEMKDARRNLGRALMAGVFAVIAIYLLVNLAFLRALGLDALGRTLTPTTDVLGRAFGPFSARLGAAAIALSALAFVSQSMLTGPRIYFAMARDGLFFRQVGNVGQRSGAPVISILLQAAWTAVLALTGSYQQILSYVVAMNFLFFGATASCLFVLRRRERIAAAAPGAIALPRRFRAPGHPFSTGLFIIACAVIVGASFWSFPVNSLIGYAILVLGLPPYLYWRRRSLAHPA